MDASQKKTNTVAISPCNTPRSDKSNRDRDFRSNDGSNSASRSSRIDKEKGVNVQVLLRCRPLSEEESKLRIPVVISCNEGRREVTAMQNIANKQIDRTFIFDKVFGPASKQSDLFQQAISPIVKEVLEGYNCTVFAYGQTGTGKTYTMEGGAGRKIKNGEFPSDAGVIPRAVRQIFDTLEEQLAEYTMKVMFCELYNEEMTDLLAPEESKFTDDKSKKPIALMEDGKGGVLLRGLEEEFVKSASEIYKILDKGSAKRRTAETLLNKQSSRSHSIFSITIHIKECTPEGEEMIKCGKLNLVDLAGSENISRSGARDGRAREAGEINKSLLTLGRVINALVEHSGHVPYRDSKLTRLLRDSLGGKTKTCIIATVSPSIHCLEETLSTLDYAHRAKNIKNKPEVNQKMMKSAMMKDLYYEIERLKQEVFSAREKNGIYIPRDRYLQEESEKKAMVEKIERLELDLDSKDKQLIGLQELYNSQKLLTAGLKDELEKTQKRLTDTENVLLDLEERYKQTISTIKEKEFIISNLLRSEKVLVERAFELRLDLENAASDVSGLFAKIERKDKIEHGNKLLVENFQSQLTNQLELLHKTVSSSVIQQENQLKEMEDDMQSFVSTKSEATEELRARVGKLKNLYGSGISALDNLSVELDGNSKLTLSKLNDQILTHSSSIEDCFKGIALEADELLKGLQDSLCEHEERLSLFAQQQRESHIKAVETARSISKISTDFFSTLDLHMVNLTRIMEETQTAQDQKLCELEKKFEDCAANEEKQLLEKVASMLANSSSRKKLLVQTAIDGLRQSAAGRTQKLNEEMCSTQVFTSSVKKQLTSHIHETENQYHDNTVAVENGCVRLEEGLTNCKENTSLASIQWRNAQETLLSIENSNVTSIDSIVRIGIEANQKLREKLSSAASNVLQDVDVENMQFLSSVDFNLKLDHDARENIDSVIIPTREELRGLKSSHHHHVVEITANAGKCLEEEYAVDEPSCSTPKKRTINLPSASSIEELRTPAFEDLLKFFWESKSGAKFVNGDVKHLLGSYDSQTQAWRDSRMPLTTLN
ncbi:Kinesin-related protein-like [Zostera marina]|uniref:Kinesin-related protein-like n=1 Tax=Zostera marina TaxID=29655 RepID=A0A0K9P5M1_ZOSMR|nr:Kinesin-related protein-like [Zostera marina]